MEAKGDSVFRVFYGAGGVNIDVTFDALLQCCQSVTLDIPGTNREQDMLFSDPYHGVTKHIMIQENDQTRAFEQDQPVHYVCQLNGEMLRCASILRKKGMSGEDFAMQIVTSMYAQAHGCLLKIGARFGVPQKILSENNIQTTVVEADYNRALLLAAVATNVIVRPCALAYQPIVLVGSHLESLDTLQQHTIKPPNGQTVMLHDKATPDGFSQVPPHLEYKSMSSNSTLPSILSSDIGLSRRTVEELEQGQNASVFDTLMFDSLRSFEFLLRDAAPRLLIHAQTVIVGVKIPQHRVFCAYVATQMTGFGFELRQTFAYRNTFELHVWRKTKN